MSLGSVGTYFSSLRTVVTLKVNVVNVATGLLSVFLGGLAARRRFYAVNVSTSLSLNILLTLMIVARLVLHSRDIRAILGAPLSGTSGLYKTTITMLIESCALFAVNSLLVIGLLFTNNHAANTFLAILAIIQVRVYPVAAVLTRVILTSWLIEQVIAPFLIIRRVADRSALTSTTTTAGVISSLKVRNQVELTGVSTAFSGGNLKDSVGGCRTSSGELEVEIMTDFRRDSKV